ncbi:MAG: signal peptidase I [Bacteroidales bacterium]|nr:signal peptidase I [Bacteroidales bacterium]
MSVVKRKKVIEKILLAVLFAAILYTIKNLLFTYVLMTFKVPTPSMEPTVMAGEHILVNKMSLGRRVFDVIDRDSIRHGKIRRGYAMSEPHRGDLFVFNETCFLGWDTIAFDLTKYFVKRCVALPGDSFYIDSCRYHIVGSDEVLGFPESQEIHEKITRDTAYVRYVGMPYATLPFWDKLGWNVRNFGPLYIPQKGDTIFFNENNMRLYRKYIEWELGHKIVWDDKGFSTPDGSPIKYHIMQQNYYFMCGDNTSNSLDSRFWGLVPEEFIVGRVDWIL